MSKFYYLTQKQIPNYAAKVAVLRDESVRLKLGLIILADFGNDRHLHCFGQQSGVKNFALKTHGERLREVRREHTRMEIEIASKNLWSFENSRRSASCAPKNLQYIESDSPVAKK